MSLLGLYLQGIILHGRAYFQNFMVHTYKNTHRQIKTNKTKIKEKNNNLVGFLAETKLSFIELRKSNGKLQ